MKENLRKCLKCGKSPADDPNVILHRFPRPGIKNSLRCELWAKFCYPNDEWSSREFQERLHKDHRMLCNRHFKHSSFIDKDRKKLVRSAAPDETLHERSSLSISPEYLHEAGPSKITCLAENVNILNIDTSCGEKETNEKNTAITVVLDKKSDEKSSLTKEHSDYEHEAGPSQPSKIARITDTSCHILTLNLDTGNENAAGPSRIQEEKPEVVQKINENLLILKKKERHLYMKCQKQMKRINRLQKSMKRLKNEAFLNALANDDSVNKLLETKLSSTFALLLQGQLKNYKRETKGRRWNTASKIIALRLYKRSPTCYKLLRRLICLPTPSTLKTLLSNFKWSTGRNEQIFNVLKKTSIKQEPADNEYVLMFDEMSIKKNIIYNKKGDLIDGFQDHAEQGRSPQIASHALVFMVAGIRKKVKQPVAYYLSGGSVTADRLAVLIKEVLRNCYVVGLNIAATVCDMDGVNKRALGILGATVEQPSITVQGIDNEIVTLFDTPHLLKCFRNNFLKYNIKCASNISSNEKPGIGIAKWSHIEKFFELDNSNPNFVFAPCLRIDHLNPNTKQKMKVKLAAQVLSHTVAAGIYAKIAQGELPAEAVTTANVLSNMDKLFDCVNAASPDLRRGKPYSTNLKKNSIHYEHFKEMKSFFKNLEFLGSRRAPPSLEGWIWTLNGIEKVWRMLTAKHSSIRSLATRRLQQDPLENLFGCIRGHCGSNTNPTAGQFVAGLKTAVLSNMSQVSLGNCEKDENDSILDNFITLLTPATKKSIEDVAIDFDSEFTQIDSLDEEDVLSGEFQACAYVSGFIIKNRPTKCEKCDIAFVSDTQNESHNFVDIKEYQETKKSLKYATKDLTMCVEKCATLVNSFLDDKAHETTLKEKITDAVKKTITFDFLDHCKSHKQQNVNYLIKSAFHICVKRFCTVKNRKFSEEASASALKRKIDILKHK